MRKVIVLQSAVIGVLLLTLLAMAFAGDRGITLVHADTDVGSDEVPPSDRSFGEPAAPTAQNATPTTLVYFSPQDNDANATVVMLYNTTAVTQTIVVKAYVAGGASGARNVAVGPSSLVHLISDGVAASASPLPSWANSVVINFTDSTTYATLELPAGVKIDGYIVFNPGTGTIDPRVDQGAIPLRFSTDPYAVMLPTVNR